MGQKALEYCAKMSLHLDGSMHRNFRDQICGKSTGDGKNMAFDGIDFLPFCRCSFGSAVFYRNGSIWNRTWSFGFLVSEKGGGKLENSGFMVGALGDDAFLVLQGIAAWKEKSHAVSHDIVSGNSHGNDVYSSDASGTVGEPISFCGNWGCAV